MGRTNSNERPPRARTLQDTTLLRRACKGDRAAFRDLFLRYLPALERFVNREIRYREDLGRMERGLLDPHAIIDQVYLAALQNVARVPKEVAFRAWLCHLATHVLRQNARVEHEEEPAGRSLDLTLPESVDVDTELWEFYQPDDTVSVEDVVADSRGGSDPQEWAAYQETARELETRINQLPTDLRQAFVLRVLEEIPVEQIAALQGKPATAIRQAVHDAREALREPEYNRKKQG